MEGSIRGDVRQEDACEIERQSLQHNYQTSDDIWFRVLGHEEERREQTKFSRNEDVGQEGRPGWITSEMKTSGRRRT